MDTLTKGRCLNPEVIDENAILPKVDQISMDFYWIAIEDLWGVDSGDFSQDDEDYYGDGYVPGITKQNLQYKLDNCVEEFIDSIKKQGFKDPIYFPNQEVRNGHHRLSVAWLLGYTHVPYTTDSKAITLYSDISSRGRRYFTKKSGNFRVFS